MADAGAPSKITVVLAGPPTPAAEPAQAEPRVLSVELGEAQRIGRFELIRELARGGMGQVFLARDTKLGRRVAVKFLLHADPHFASRFVIEAQATARCTHDNIVTIYEVGEHQKLPFMVLEYLEGKTLSQRLQAGVGSHEIVDIMIAVAQALDCAHAAGIVHRDLKPSNIFITDQGVVKVLDFGVAKCFDAPVGSGERGPALPTVDADTTYVTVSEHGSFVGTAPYMSPEQWGADTVDHASDLWAIGIMFWRALAATHPAGSTAPESLRAELTQLDVPLAGIAEYVPSIAPQLAAIIDRCVAKRKVERYSSARQLLADLIAFAQPAHDGGSPYRGLAAFDEHDAPYFFGRANEIRTAVAQLDAWPLLAVLGPSGAGKTSFVRAGLVPAIRATGEWTVHVLRPGRAPLANLTSVVSRDRTLVARIHEAPGWFGQALRDEAAASRRRILVVVDQLEELFTLCDDDEARATFLAALMSAADDPSSPIRIVVSMRADFIDRLAAHKPFFADASRGLCFLSIPSAAALRETVVRPAELAGYTFEDPAIVDDMLQATSSRGGLPLLQFATTRLWEARDERRKLVTAAAYKQMGGVGGAFSRHAEQVVSAVPSRQLPLLRAIMMRLVTSEGTRAIVDRAELASLASEPGAVDEVLDHLLRARLVHVNTDEGATVELVHEVLITEWPTLRRWLDDDQAARVLSHELGQAAKQWETRGRPVDLVWRGNTAREALVIADRVREPVWSASEQDFIAALRAQLARTRRRRVIVMATIASALALVLAGGAVAVVRIADAEQTALHKAADAEAEALRARTAEGETARQLELVKAEATRRRKAEDERAAAERSVTRATRAVAMSREELERANVDLQHALTRSQETEARAREAAAKEREASAALTAANAKLSLLLGQERARVQDYERERKNIATKLKGKTP